MSSRFDDRDKADIAEIVGDVLAREMPKYFTHFSGVIVEDLIGQLRPTEASLLFIKEQVAEIPSMKADIAEMKNDNIAFKAAMRDLSLDHNQTKARVSKLESVTHSH